MKFDIEIAPFPFQIYSQLKEFRMGLPVSSVFLQTLRNITPVLFSLAPDVEAGLPLTLYAFVTSCLVYEGDHNVITSTLEVLQVILQHVDQLPEFSSWLVNPSSDVALIEPFVSGSLLLVFTTLGLRQTQGTLLTAPERGGQLFRNDFSPR